MSRSIQWMREALRLAELAEKHGDVPVGALVVDENEQVIARACNERELRHDPTAHAEVLALREASKFMGSWRLSGCTLVVTLEPCLMCAGAALLSRVDRVIYGTKDLRAGAMGSSFSVHNDTRLNHAIVVESGVLEHECRELLQNFFRSLR